MTPGAQFSNSVAEQEFAHELVHIELGHECTTQFEKHRLGSRAADFLGALDFLKINNFIMKIVF